MMIGGSLIEEEKLKKVSVIKIDVEGGEAKVIEGLLNTIKSFEPYILCEILPLSSKDTDVTQFRTSSAQYILSSLAELNFTAHNIKDRENECKGRSLSIEEKMKMEYSKNI